MAFFVGICYTEATKLWELLMKRILCLLAAVCLLLCACDANAENGKTAPDTTEQVNTAPTEHSAPPTAAPTEAPTEPPSVEELAQKRIAAILGGELKANSAHIEVEEMSQYPELPTGCEAVALTMALNALGGKLDKTEIAEKYLVYDDNYAVGYVGDPFSDGGAGIWPIGMVKTVENYTADTGAKVYAQNTSKLPLSDLCKLVAAGCPVLVWTTYYISEPMYTDDGMEYDGEYYMWYDNEHCVTLCGYDMSDGTVTIADPLQGIVTEDAEYFERINKDIGGYSMVLLDTSGL